MACFGTSRTMIFESAKHYAMLNSTICTQKFIILRYKVCLTHVIGWYCIWPLIWNFPDTSFIFMWDSSLRSKIQISQLQLNLTADVVTTVDSKYEKELYTNRIFSEIYPFYWFLFTEKLSEEGCAVLVGQWRMKWNLASSGWEILFGWLKSSN